MRILTTLLVTLIAFQALGKDILATSKIESVIVFTQGASITRLVDVDLPAGQHKIIIRDVDQYLLDKSIQVSEVDGVSIVSVNNEFYRATEVISKGKLKVLEDSLQLIDVQRRNELNGKFSYEQELAMILKNQEIKGNQTLSIDDVYEFSTLYRKLIPEIKSKILISELLIEKLDKQINDLKIRIANLSKPKQTNTRDIHVVLKSNKDIKTSFKVSYYTQRASWKPVYDIRSKDVGNDIELSYKAEIQQWTNHTWEDVHITLSTGNPSLSGEIPQLDTWWLDFDYNRRVNASVMHGITTAVEINEYSDEEVSMARDKKYSRKIEITESGNTVNFTLPQKHNIQNESKSNLVAIESYQLPTDYKYVVVPKKSNHAYLTAHFSDWRKLNLLPGSTNIYFDDGFVGNGSIDPNQTSDTLEVSLGVDQNIVVSREKTNDFSKNQVLKGTITRRLAYQTTIANGKSKPVSMIVKDQLPVPIQNKIEVNALNISSGSMDDKTKMIEWEFELPANGSQIVDLEYEVVFPKDKRVKL